MTSKVSTERTSPNVRIGDDLNYNIDYIYDENYAHRLKRAGTRFYEYDSNGNITAEYDKNTIDESAEQTENDTERYSHTIREVAEGVEAVDYGWGLFKEDDKLTTKYGLHKRTYNWNERNLSRIVTKLNSADHPTLGEENSKQYYYHSDHLGSATLITDYDGKEYQRIEYTPYGELWVEKTSNTGNEFLPYKFTGKEMDEETGLYYYGARYLDPKYSWWLSTDPALGEYFSVAPVNDDARKQNQNLPGMGGLFNTVNANLYHYAGNNPIMYTDPDGKTIFMFGLCANAGCGTGIEENFGIYLTTDWKGSVSTWI